MLAVALAEWTRAAPAAAAAWIDQFEPSPALDTGVGGVAARAMDVDHKPAVALDRLSRVADPELQASVLGDLVRSWAGFDSRGATRYLTSAPALTSAQRTALLASVQAVASAAAAPR